MADPKPVLCPGCSWTGQTDDLIRTYEGAVCPVCEQPVALE
jgi:hypothetical protein